MALARAAFTQWAYHSDEMSDAQIYPFLHFQYISRCFSVLAVNVVSPVYCYISPMAALTSNSIALSVNAKADSMQ